MQPTAQAVGEKEEIDKPRRGERGVDQKAALYGKDNVYRFSLARRRAKA
jgi:hypothetical protein